MLISLKGLSNCNAHHYDMYIYVAKFNELSHSTRGSDHGNDRALRWDEWILCELKNPDPMCVCMIILTVILANCVAYPKSDMGSHFLLFVVPL